MSHAERTLVTVATYNEMENLPRLVDEIFRAAPQVDLLVIDDNSPDGTGQWCDRKKAEDPRLHCLHRQGKLGLGTAIVAGMRYALEQGYKYVLNMDADFSHQPRYLPDLIAGMQLPHLPSEGPENLPPHGQAVDVMIGSRYVAGGGTEGWPLKRRLMSRAVNLYARWLLGLRPKDCSGAFRCYRTELLARLDFDAIRSRGYSFQEEILWHLKRLGARFAETPIIFIDRQRGASKIDPKEAIAALRIIFTLGLRNLLKR
jgi:dolichol-phosphate mannosyltransferase